MTGDDMSEPVETPGPEAEPIEAKVVETPEVVERPAPATGAEVVPLHPEQTAMDRAAEAAMMPGVPGRDEFLTLAMTAKMLSLSGAAPKEIRNNPYIAFHVAMVGRDLGISPSSAMDLIDVIPAAGGPQLSLSPELLNGQIKRLGLGSIVPAAKSDTGCWAVALAPGGFLDRRCARIYPEHVADDAPGGPCRCTHDLILGEEEFTWERAQTAKLAGKNCQPGAHRTDDWKCGCNSGYISHPRRMMWWRAAGFLASDVFPEASLGLYSPEELGATVDENGRAIDPATVALPEGFEPEKDPDDEPADPDVVLGLSERIAALPEEQRAELAERKRANDKLRGIRLADLPVRRIALVEAMLKGVEAQAKAKGWDPEAALAAVRAADDATAPAKAEEGSPAPDGENAPETEPEAPTAGESGGEADPPQTVGDLIASGAVTKGKIPPVPKARRDAADVAALTRLAEVDGDALDVLVRESKALTIGEVEQALVAAALTTAGSPDSKRQRLCALWARERHADLLAESPAGEGE